MAYQTYQRPYRGGSTPAYWERPKLTPRDRDLIRQLKGEGVPARQLALAFGISRRYIDSM